jgi:topoisomerase-4 subunit A
VTVVLSASGWVRAAKGHDIDPVSLSYKSGDGYLSSALGKSTQTAVFVDNKGRAYCLPAHSLPSARGQGEPLTGRLNPAPGTSFRGVLLGDPDARCLLASDAGYGFFARLGDLLSRNRAGKACLRVPDGGDVLIPAPVTGADFPGKALVAALSSEGRLLVFPAADLPELPRGKGNKIFGISSRKFKAGEEKLLAVAVLEPGESLLLVSNQRTMTLKPADLGEYRGARSQRGGLLPRGWRKIDRMLVGPAAA